MVTPTSSKSYYPTSKIEEAKKHDLVPMPKPHQHAERRYESFTERKVELVKEPLGTSKRADDYAQSFKRKERDEDYSEKRPRRDDRYHREEQRSHYHARYEERAKDTTFHESGRHIAYARSSQKQPVEARSVAAGDIDPKTIRPDFTFTIQSRPDAPYIDYLRRGEKTAECRVNGHMYQRLKEGQILLFHNRNEGIFCQVTFLHRYASFKEMVENEGVTNLLPQLKKLNLSAEDLVGRAVRIYEGFPGSDNVRRFGSIAIGVKYLCDKPKI